jgi:hypothetical protein
MLQDMRFYKNILMFLNKKIITVNYKKLITKVHYQVNYILLKVNKTNN